jgi:arabinan endo-1,5-alpha-L-arabinosidase
MPHRQFWRGIALSVATILTGCGGGSGGGGGTTPPTTTDMGTLTSMGDTYTYTFKNAASSLILGINGQSQTAGTAVVQESSGTSDTYWHFMPMGNNEYNVENMLTHQVLGILNASTSTGAQALQYSDNGTADHLWAFYLLTDGNYLIKNVNSGYYLQDEGSGTTSSATIDQGARSSSVTGCTCQEWTITSSGTAAYSAPLTVSGTGIYVHDPFMLQDPTTHTYWLFGTHQTIAYSTDFATFTYTTETVGSTGACTSTQGGYWITDDNHCPIIGPDFASWSGLQTPLQENNAHNTDLWAPDVLYDSGTSTYYQYYAVPYDPSTGAEAVIGLATATTPYGPWTDKGYVVSSWTNATSTAPTNNAWNFVNTTTWNAIDPSPFIDASGNWWLIFGSWSDGTHLLELQSPSSYSSTATIGFPVSSGSNAYPVSTATAISTWTKIGYRSAGEEGPFIYYWNGYYYYFAPINTCCVGTSSTYREIVGRSTSVTGPYYDRGGVSLANGGGTILISSHSNVYGPGGASVFTDTGSDGTKSLPTIVYHYYDGNNNGTPTLGINRLNFTADGWPYI